MISHHSLLQNRTIGGERPLFPTTRSTYVPVCVYHWLHPSSSWDAKSPLIKGQHLLSVLLKDFSSLLLFPASSVYPSVIFIHCAVWFPVFTKAPIAATFLSSYSLLYRETSPKYCLHILLPFFIYKLLFSLLQSGSQHIFRAFSWSFGHSCTFDPSLLHQTFFFLSFMTYSPGVLSISLASASYAILLAHPFRQDTQVLTCHRTWLWVPFCPLPGLFLPFFSFVFSSHFIDSRPFIYVLPCHKFHLYNEFSIPELFPWSFWLLYPTVNLESPPECFICILTSECLKQNS